jgi:hypothetical protein
MNAVFGILMVAILALCLAPVFLVGLALAKHAVLRKRERFYLAIGRRQCGASHT